MNILFLDHYYHRITKSSDFFINLLKELGHQVHIRYDYTADLSNKEKFNEFELSELYKNKYDYYIVWQSEELLKTLFSVKSLIDEKIIFVPMLDSAMSWDFVKNSKFFKRMSKVKVLCFSNKLAEILREKGINSLYTRYFPEVDEKPQIRKNIEGINIAYWHRLSSYERALVKFLTLIPPTEIKKINLKNYPDPGNKRLSENFKSYFKKAAIELEEHDWSEDNTKWINTIKESNLYVASRQFEGIGLSFIDALAAGVPVMGVNSATLNEYVIDNHNGFLITDNSKEIVNLEKLKKIENSTKKIAKQYSNTWKKVFAEKINLLFTDQSTRVTLKKKNVINHLENKSNKNLPKISIITVHKNDIEGLTRTYESIKNQNYPNWEWILVDGLSDAQYSRVLKSYSLKADTYISQQDSGPYEGMMNGALKAKGKFLYFLNSGDLLYSESAISNIIELMDINADLIYCDYIYKDGESEIYKSPVILESVYQKLVHGDITGNWLEGIPCHQGVLIKKEALITYPYDLTLKVAADHNFYFEIVANKGKTQKISAPLGIYYAGGLSATEWVNCINDWRSVAIRFSQDIARVNEFYRELAINQLISRGMTVSDEVNIIRKSGLFDQKWYSKFYKVSDKNMELHFCTSGWKKGMSPFPFFGIKYYYENNKDVARNLINPLIHFILFGRHEGRYPSELIEKLCSHIGRKDLNIDYNKLSELIGE